ncbi:related to coenzyme A transporter [Rhynchosporium secalis]|uniref:Related to coenzyme A transporter n=1 Tax=Rhynchosporium secalis TaxID=38038 RepID=A0A1E1MS30_RHYSE|nr:related to coenzyme A transporter [Rhynchosporium secalis]
MSSGSLKDLTRSITAAVPNLTLPLPSDLKQVIDAYLEKHSTYDDSDNQRLQEELLTIYQSSILDHPPRFAPFLALLRALQSNIRGSGRLLQWWDKLSGPVIIHLGVEKGLAFEARDSLLGILIYDDEEEEEHLKDAKATSAALAEILMSTWLVKSKLALEELNDHARFVEGQTHSILLAFGTRRPSDLLTTINKFVVQKNSRIPSLSLLCDFFRHEPPHLHLLLQTPLFDNLLRCLQIDTSTRAISLAMTSLIMFLPHIPITSSKHLPALFNIYSRMLFWDKERKKVDQPHPHGDDEEALPPEGRWEKLSYLLESEDETVPELLHYFTFLYGLYPINFMSYIRKPQRYLRYANFPGADDLEIEPTEIRKRSEGYRQVHLMHPNFFMLTLETELTDTQRWQKSSAADVVAECMALFVPDEENHQRHISRARGPMRRVDLERNADVPEQPLLDQDATSFQHRHAAWRDTRSTMVASPEGYRSISNSGLNRRASQTSQSMPSSAVAESPSLQASERHDSPNLPPQHATTLSDMLSSQVSTRGSLHRVFTNDSEASFSLSHPNHTDAIHMGGLFSTLTGDAVPRSPSLRPTTGTTGTSTRVAYLQREIQLLKNDLNFERYLKQQHLSHIGKIRRQQIREARVEAETQHLMNYNRGLKAKLVESQRVNTQIRKETEKSKLHSRKWEADLTNKLRVLREEQKKWVAERDRLVADLATAQESNTKLMNITVEAESRALSASQTVESVKSNLEEFERLRKYVDEMNTKILKFEAGERSVDIARENETAALNRVYILEMELAARDNELAQAREAFDDALDDMRKLYRDRDDADSYKSGTDEEKMKFGHVFIDTALAASRHRINDLTLSHNHLLKRYTRLQNAYIQLQEQVEDLPDNEASLHGGNGLYNLSNSNSNSNRSPSSSNRWKNRAHARSDPESGTIFEGNVGGFNANASFPMRPNSRIDTSTPYRYGESVGGRSPVSATGGGYPGSHFQTPQPYTTGPVMAPSMAGTGRSSESTGDGVPKVKPQSEVRVFGRGGVQNIGKEVKKKDKAKEKEAAKNDGAPVTPEQPAKEKKEKIKMAGGMRGIRGFGNI